MKTIQKICKWLDNRSYDRVIAKHSDGYIILFYDHAEAMSAIYVLSVYEHEKLIYIGNVFCDGVAKVGYTSAIKTTEMTADTLFVKISEVAKQIDKEENLEYYDELMKHSQKFKEVMPIITQYILSAHYNIISHHSK